MPEKFIANTKPPLLVLAGPTAVGKTELSLSLAEALNGEIVSADSMQVYRGMDIGTAKATAKERARVPHHLIDVCDPREEYHVARYAEEAKAAIRDILARGRLPLLVGGTGFYIQAVLKDLDFSEGDRDESYRLELQQLAEARGPEAVHELLAARDPASAAAIHPHNLKRVIRALEYFKETGRSIQEANLEQQEQASPYHSLYLVLNLPREVLYERIDRRVDLMLAGGLEEEVKKLRDLGCRRGMVSMQALGYKEMLDCMEGLCTLEEAGDKIRLESRHYAKRQITWFKREKEAVWIEKAAYAGEQALQQAVLMKIREEFKNEGK